MKRWYLFYAIVLLGCSINKWELTPSYVINGHWDHNSANFIEITRLIEIEDSVLNPFTDPNQAELLTNLRDDSSFAFHANVEIPKNSSYAQTKVFFDRENSFTWRSGDLHSDKEVKIIGRLQPDTWYKIAISHLSDFESLYVYVDSNANLHQFPIIHENY